MDDSIYWHGYDPATIYSAQDDCLNDIRNGKPLRADLLQRIPPLRAFLLASIAEKANTGLEKGTFEQLKAEAETVGDDGKLGDWWIK